MGRASLGGPVAGAYVAIADDWGRASTTPGAVTVSHKRTVPAAFRVSAIEISCESASGGASRPTVNVNDGTGDLLTADVTVVTADKVYLDASTTSPTSLVKARRNQAKGNVLTFTVDCVASEAILGLAITVWGYLTDHINVKPNETTGVVAD